MKAARLAVLSVAVVAAAGAGFLAMKVMNQKPKTEIVTVDAPAIETEKVLVAAADIPMGTSITPDMLGWQDWPEKSIAPGFVTRSAVPDAIEDAAEAIARAPIFQGEPIRENKLVKSKQGFMSAILPKGQRAVATAISTATSAGGFILPNDRVDVLMTRRRTGEGEEGFSTEVILENVRVLAIDQTIQEQDGDTVVVGETATLQLTPKQVEILAIAQQTADSLSLALRSIADANEASTKSGEHLLKGGPGNVRIIRYGNVRETNTAASGNSDE